MFGIPGGWELIAVLLVVLLFFGSTRLPQLARSMGQASKEFKKGIKDSDADNSSTTDEEGPEQVR